MTPSAVEQENLSQEELIRRKLERVRMINEEAERVAARYAQHPGDETDIPGMPCTQPYRLGGQIST